MRGDDVEPDEIRVHRRERVREGLGHLATEFENSDFATGLLATRQLHPFGEAAPRRPDPNRRRRSVEPVHMGSGEPDAPNQSRADVERPRLLRPRHQPRFEGLLQLLLRRKHRRLGPSQPSVGPAVPGTHGRRFVH